MPISHVCRASAMYLALSPPRAQRLLLGTDQGAARATPDMHRGPEHTWSCVGLGRLPHCHGARWSRDLRGESLVCIFGCVSRGCVLTGAGERGRRAPALRLQSACTGWSSTTELTAVTLGWTNLILEVREEGTPSTLAAILGIPPPTPYVFRTPNRTILDYQTSCTTAAPNRSPGSMYFCTFRARREFFT